MARTLLSDDELERFRRRLVEVATRCFAERGYDAVTMRGLARELGVSAMTPYRYIANKDALLSAVRAESFRRFADRQAAADGERSDRDADRNHAGSGAAIARLLRLKRAYLAFAIEEPHAYRIMFELGAPGPTDARVDAEGARAFSYLYRATAAAIEEGALQGDPLTVAHLLWANTHGLVMLHLAGRLTNGRTLDELASMTLELSPATRNLP